MVSGFFRKCLLVLSLSSLFLILTPRAKAAEESPKDDDKSKITAISVTSGVGTVAVAGAGGLVIAHNSKKEKDTPSAEIREIKDEN